MSYINLDATHRLKPVEVQARQVTDETIHDVQQWTAHMGTEVYQRYFMGKPQVLVLAWPGSVIEASAGDWVLKHAHGSFSVVTDEAFKRQYEQVPELRVLDHKGTEEFIQSEDDRCPVDGMRMEQHGNPDGGDAWFYVCPNRHGVYVGK